MTPTELLLIAERFRIRTDIRRSNTQAACGAHRAIRGSCWSHPKSGRAHSPTVGCAPAASALRSRTKTVQSIFLGRPFCSLHQRSNLPGLKELARPSQCPRDQASDPSSSEDFLRATSARLSCSILILTAWYAKSSLAIARLQDLERQLQRYEVSRPIQLCFLARIRSAPRSAICFCFRRKGF